MKNSEEILLELNRRVAERRQQGKYPIGLEAQLSAEFDAIVAMVHRGSDTIGAINSRINEMVHEIDEIHGRVNSASRFPGGSLFHRLTGKLVSRQTHGLAAQTRKSLHLVAEAMRLVERQLVQQQEADARVLNQIEHAMLDRLMMIDVLAEAVLELERKVDAGQ
jgi:hypothetical protein